MWSVRVFSAALAVLLGWNFFQFVDIYLLANYFLNVLDPDQATRFWRYHSQLPRDEGVRCWEKGLARVVWVYVGVWGSKMLAYPMIGVHIG